MHFKGEIVPFFPKNEALGSESVNLSSKITIVICHIKWKLGL